MPRVPYDAGNPLQVLRDKEGPDAAGTAPGPKRVQITSPADQFAVGLTAGPSGRFAQSRLRREALHHFPDDQGDHWHPVGHRLPKSQATCTPRAVTIWRRLLGHYIPPFDPTGVPERAQVFASHRGERLWWDFWEELGPSIGALNQDTCALHAATEAPTNATFAKITARTTHLRVR